MNGYIKNISALSLENENFRKVLYTTTNSQLVLMSLQPKEEIGEEVHHLDQFIRCEAGIGMALLNGVAHEITEGMILLVPSGARHNITNSSSEKPLKLHTLYSPPNHRDGVIHRTKAEADADHEDSFDGKTTE